MVKVGAIEKEAGQDIFDLLESCAWRSANVRKGFLYCNDAALDKERIARQTARVESWVGRDLSLHLNALGRSASWIATGIAAGNVSNDPYDHAVIGFHVASLVGKDHLRSLCDVPLVVSSYKLRGEKDWLLRQDALASLLSLSSIHVASIQGLTSEVPDSILSALNCARSENLVERALDELRMIVKPPDGWRLHSTTEARLASFWPGRSRGGVHTQTLISPEDVEVLIANVTVDVRDITERVTQTQTLIELIDCLRVDRVILTGCYCGNQTDPLFLRLKSNGFSYAAMPKQDQLGDMVDCVWFRGSVELVGEVTEFSRDYVPSSDCDTLNRISLPSQNFGIRAEFRVHHSDSQPIANKSICFKPQVDVEDVAAEPIDSVPTNSEPAETASQEVIAPVPPALEQNGSDDVEKSVPTPQEVIAPVPPALEQNGSDDVEKSVPTPQEVIAPVPPALEQNGSDDVEKSVPTPQVAPDPTVMEGNESEDGDNQVPTPEVVEIDAPVPTAIEQNVSDYDDKQVPSPQVFITQPGKEISNFDFQIAIEKEKLKAGCNVEHDASSLGGPRALASVPNVDEENELRAETPVEAWTPRQVQLWAESVGFPEVGAKFAAQGIDGEELLELDLKDRRVKSMLGLTVGKALRLKKAIDPFKSKMRTHDSVATLTTVASNEAVDADLSPTSSGRPSVSEEKGATEILPPPSTVPYSETEHVFQVHGRARNRQPAQATQVERKTLASTVSEMRSLPLVHPIGTGEIKIDKKHVSMLVESMLGQAEDGDIDVAVVSVTGKFRGGKSFLLNLLAHYFLWLEQNQDRLRDAPREKDMSFQFSNDSNRSKCWLPEWLPEEIATPFRVDAISDTQSCTLGLWMLDRPFFFRKPGTDRKVALLLMDSQGADDGMISEAASRAILGITTVVSSAVVYNVKMPLDVKHIRDMGEMANVFQVAIDELASSATTAVPEHRPFGRLLFFLRDARFPEGSSLDQCLQALARGVSNKLDPKQVRIYKDRLLQIHDSFASPMQPPFGLPHPGNAADFAKMNSTRNMEQINDSFKVLLDEFLRVNFESSFPEPVNRVIVNKPLTACTFCDYLERIMAGFSSCTISGGDPELVLMYHEEKAETDFVEEIDKIVLDSQDHFPFLAVEKLKQDMLGKFSQLPRLAKCAEESQKRWGRKYERFMECHVALRENHFSRRRSNGEKAVAATLVGTSIAMCTPLWSLACAHVCLAAVGGACLVAVGYARHAANTNRSVRRIETVRSFFRVSVERSIDMFRATKRLPQNCAGAKVEASKGHIATNSANSGSNLLLHMPVSSSTVL
eukprot:TRINITY_DN13169_c0_g1_i1.p1 TRINITY_DN13169_c0_g1~~TRINITY_DN13169_c0_g1_i1.p1  ORF type:complete len:1382 (-),score=230.86 TRINITY_DN13169_c0_g1_i1:72-3992(-)